ncbi:MAG: nickel transporter [Methanomicrobiales archaeon]|jgi:phosphoribosylformimino-5-aminoimidazole carboxamide ribotide isomerase|nr:nickel transporter [Methanomicrobiales archaeon]
MTYQSRKTKKLKLILAIDLMNGLVVHGKSGQRDTYAPLTWGLSPSAVPKEYIRNLRPRYVYIADLNSILEQGDNIIHVQQIAPCVDQVLLDKGDRDPNSLIQIPSVLPIIGTETAGCDPKKLSQYSGVLSVDIKCGVTIPCERDPVEFLYEIQHLSFEAIIILNISTVGTGAGLNPTFLTHLRAATPLPLYYGGGVATTKDLDMLAAASFDGAIIATAVHKGDIPLSAIQKGCW